MDGSKILGILIIIGLILSISIVGVNSFILNTNNQNGNSSSIILPVDNLENATLIDSNITNKTELNFVLNDSSSVQPVVNLNIHQKVGGVEIMFADTDNIYNITSTNYNNSSTTVNYEQTNETIDVDMSTNSAGNVIVLSNKYIYNINCEVLSGGVSGNFTPESKINNLNVNITLGGIDLNLNNNKIQNINTHVTVGGINVQGSPSGYSHLESEVKVGGLNFENNNGKVYVRSSIELGGNNPGNAIHETIKGWDMFKQGAYDSSEDKLDVTSHIQIGGLNMQ